MRLEPVVADAASVVAAVARSTGQGLSLHGELDLDVYRLRSAGPGPDLVARVFGPEVEGAALDTAARVLTGLAGTRFPAERCGLATPVLTLGEGIHVLVTEYVVPSPAPRPGFLLAWCAGLLGRLVARSADSLPAGGGWHRLGTTPSAEIDSALALGGAIGAPVSEIVDALADSDDGVGLPEGLVHADLTPANAVPRGHQAPVIIDWVGAGRGPRIWPLASLLHVAGPAGASRVLDRYTASVPLSDEERVRLPAVMTARPLALDLWSVAHERMPARTAVARCRAHRSRIDRVAEALGAPSPTRRRAKTGAAKTGAGKTGASRTDGGPSGAPIRRVVSETLPFDGGRRVRAYVPPVPPDAIVYAGDGQLLASWQGTLGSKALATTMVVATDRSDDEVLRLLEYSPGGGVTGPTSDPARFAAHEEFFVNEVRMWVRSRFDLTLPGRRTAVFGVSAGGELALAMGLRHPDVYGTVLCASPGGGYRPPPLMPEPVPHAYLVAGTEEPFFCDNARRWAGALRRSGARVEMVERSGTHGGPFWAAEFPLMVAWAFGGGLTPARDGPAGDQYPPVGDQRPPAGRRATG